jgi:hypothetical protein
MPYYNLTRANEIEPLPAVRARDRDHALTIFGEQLGCRLTVEDPQGVAAQYMLGESDDPDHWVKRDIPVWEVSN